MTKTLKKMQAEANQKAQPPYPRAMVTTGPLSGLPPIEPRKPLRDDPAEANVLAKCIPGGSSSEELSLGRGLGRHLGANPGFDPHSLALRLRRTGIANHELFASGVPSGRCRCGPEVNQLTGIRSVSNYTGVRPTSMDRVVGVGKPSTSNWPAQESKSCQYAV